MEQLPYYVAPETLRQLEKSKEAVVKGDMDKLVIVDGREGSGKSTLAMQLGYALDNNLSLSNIVFNSDDFAKKIRELPKYSTIIFDEAFNGLSSKSALSKENRKLVRLLMECRQKNLFIFIVLPSIFLLEKYVALFRSHVLIHVYQARKDYRRRYYKMYNSTNKKILYLTGKTYMSYKKPKIRKSYRFYGKYPPTIDEEAYRKKKLDAFGDDDKKEEGEGNKFKEQRDFIIYKMVDFEKIPQKRISEHLKDSEYPMNAQNVGEIVRKMREKTKKPRPIYSTL